MKRTKINKKDRDWLIFLKKLFSNIVNAADYNPGLFVRSHPLERESVFESLILPKALIKRDTMQVKNKQFSMIYS